MRLRHHAGLGDYHRVGARNRASFRQGEDSGRYGARHRRRCLLLHLLRSLDLECRRTRHVVRYVICRIRGEGADTARPLVRHAARKSALRRRPARQSLEIQGLIVHAVFAFGCKSSSFPEDSVLLCHNGPHTPETLSGGGGVWGYGKICLLPEAPSQFSCIRKRFRLLIGVISG